MADQPPQGIQVTLEELYQIIGERSVMQFKLEAEVRKLQEQNRFLTEELKKTEK
jgi:hypothetical protein